MPTTQLRNACVTVNNYTSGQLASFVDFCRAKCSYFVIGPETAAPPNETPHLQCYLEFTTKIAFNSLHKAAYNGHIEPRHGRSKPITAAGYCKKGQPCVAWSDYDHTPPHHFSAAKVWDHFFHHNNNPSVVEEGTISSQGKRTDLLEIRDSILSGRSVDDLVVDDPLTYHQYGRTLHKLEDIALRKRFRTWMTTCDWIYGPTGVGKSHRSFQDFQPSTHYVWRADNGWQDGYTGQETVILNDFRGEIRFNELLQMIDKWPHYVKRRGREPAPFLAKHIIITSSVHPEVLYYDDHDHLDQLYRRITIIEISEKKSEV